MDRERDIYIYIESVAEFSAIAAKLKKIIIKPILLNQINLIVISHLSQKTPQVRVHPIKQNSLTFCPSFQCSTISFVSASPPKTLVNNIDEVTASI